VLKKGAAIDHRPLIDFLVLKKGAAVVWAGVEADDKAAKLNSVLNGLII
jgi:hypothetical protein